MHTTYSVIRVGGILVQFDFFVLGNPLHAITSDIVWYYIYLDYAKYYNARGPIREVYSLKIIYKLMYLS
jgi:hypothetical protein